MGTEKRARGRSAAVKSAKNTPRYDRTKALLNPTSMLISTIALALIHFQSEPAAAAVRFYFFKSAIKESNMADVFFVCPMCATRFIYMAGFLKRHSRPLYTCVYPQLAFRAKCELYKVDGLNGCF